MPPESKIPFTGANGPAVRIKGLDGILKRDLAKHKNLLERSKAELDSYKGAVSYQVKRKKYYKALIGNNQYDDDALRISMEMIAVDIRHMSDKAKLSQDAIDHHVLIVDTLTKQLDDYQKTGGICH